MSSATFESLSKQFDIIREAIIANFRDRISAGKRSKLTKQELEELIDIFITRLQWINDADLIERLCDREIALLEEGYPAASVAKNYLPKYRKAIALAIEETRIKLNERNSHSYTYFKDGESHLTTEHYALTYLKYDRADYEQFARSTIANNNLKQDSLKAVNPDLYLEAVDSLLDSSQHLELAIAIAATTGRRYSEVMAKGVFGATDHSYQIHFSGQLKKRTAHAPSQGACGRSKQRTANDDDSYTIYTLVPAKRVLTALSRFRTHPDIAVLEDASIEKINQLNTPINRLIKHYFQDTDLVPVLEGEAGVTIQNLRGIYGEIAVRFFCPPSIGVHRFIQQRLGHLITDPELSHGKNSGSTEHYFHYYLVDSQGDQLAEKGVLLEHLYSPIQKIVKDSDGVHNEASQVEQLELPTSPQLRDSVAEGEIPLKDRSKIHSLVPTTETSDSSSTKDLLPEIPASQDVISDSSTEPVSSPTEINSELTKIESLSSTVNTASEADLDSIKPPPQLAIDDSQQADAFPEQPKNDSKSKAVNSIQDLSHPQEPVISPLKSKTPSSLSTQSVLLSGDEKEFLAIIRALIDSNDYRHLLLGLMAATGLDAASLLKLLVFKEEKATHLILYCQQLHPPHQPLQQLLTLIDAEVVLNGISALRRDRSAIDFAHCLTGAEINQAVEQFTPDVLESVGLSSELNLTQQYHDLIPLLLKDNFGDRSGAFSLSPNTQSSFEQWQQHFQADVDTTLIELMRLASSALSSAAPSSQTSEGKSSSNSQESSHYSHFSFPFPNEPSPWLAISRLTETVARLSDRVIEQNERLLNMQLGLHSTSHEVSSRRSSVEPSTPGDQSKTISNSVRRANTFSHREGKNQVETPTNIPSSFDKNTTSILQSTPSSYSDSAADLTALKHLKSEDLKHSRANGAPIEKCSRALHAVIDYNQQQSTPEKMWRINTHLLQQLTGCFNSSVKAFVKEHQSIIDDHNLTFGLTSVRHNAVHKKLDPNHLIIW